MRAFKNILDNVRKKHSWIPFYSVILAVCMVFGNSLKDSNSFDAIFGNLWSVSGTCISGIIYFLIFQTCISLFVKLWRKTEYFSTCSAQATWKDIIFSMFIIMLGWLPYIIIFYPGSIPYDAMYQLNMYFGYSPMTTHHPVLSTLLMGKIISIGSVINFNFGVFLFTLFQSILCAAVYAYLCYYIKQLTKSKKFYWGSCLFFAICPVWGAFAQMTGKDTLYYAFFALFVIQISKFCLWHGIKRYDYVLLVIGALSCLFYRKDGIFVILPTLILCFAVLKKLRKQLLVSFFIVICIYFAGNSFLNQRYVDTSAALNPYEAYSNILQQVARCVKEHPEGISENERDVIDKVLRYDTLAERYDPNNADPVKNKARYGATVVEKQKLLKLWIKLLFRYPKTCMEASSNMFYGYLYPFYMYDGLTQCKFYMKGEPLNNGQYDVEYVFSNDIRQQLVRYTEQWFSYPILSVICSCGLYGWMIIAAIFSSIKNKPKLFVVILPGLMCLLISIASPVNAYIRYSLPIMAIVPLVVVIVLKGLEKKASEKN